MRSCNLIRFSCGNFQQKQKNYSYLERNHSVDFWGLAPASPSTTTSTVTHDQILLTLFNLFFTILMSDS